MTLSDSGILWPQMALWYLDFKGTTVNSWTLLTAQMDWKCVCLRERERERERDREDLRKVEQILSEIGHGYTHTMQKRDTKTLPILTSEITKTHFDFLLWKHSKPQIMSTHVVFGLNYSVMRTDHFRLAPSLNITMGKARGGNKPNTDVVSLLAVSHTHHIHTQNVNTFSPLFHLSLIHIWRCRRWP